MKHTEGPWEYDTSGEHYRPMVVRHNGMLVCQMIHGDHTEADAHLITTAPDMLKALERIRKDIWNAVLYKRIQKGVAEDLDATAKVAVDKAKGEA